MSTDSVGVVIGTFGDQSAWMPYVRRASASVEAQSWYPNCISWRHADTLHDARNWGAGDCQHCDWLIFLDADDELDPLYIEKMMESHGDIRRPSTLGVYPDGSTDDFPVMIPERRLETSNYIVIGAMVSAPLFFNCGGFADLPVLEDWDMWQRCVLAGGRVSEVPEAIYRVLVRPESRNTQQELHDATYRDIQARYAEAWREWRQ